jgi:hypothetical protein
MPQPQGLNWDWSLDTIRAIYLSADTDITLRKKCTPRDKEDELAISCLSAAKVHLSRAMDEYGHLISGIDRLRAPIPAISTKATA